MAPKRKAKNTPLPALSPRKTRSATAGKRAGPPAPAPERAPAKKRKPAAEKGKAKESKADGWKEEDKVSGNGASSKTIIIEACKQCSSFNKRATAVKAGLERAVSGLKITINPEKPRRGCFEIREEGGEIFVSLLNMPRPFTPMKSLDLEEVVEDIIKKIS